MITRFRGHILTNRNMRLPIGIFRHSINCKLNISRFVYTDKKCYFCHCFWRVWNIRTPNIKLNVVFIRRINSFTGAYVWVVKCLRVTKDVFSKRAWKTSILFTSEYYTHSACVVIILHYTPSWLTFARPSNDLEEDGVNGRSHGGVFRSCLE